MFFVQHKRQLSQTLTMNRENADEPLEPAGPAQQRDDRRRPAAPDGGPPRQQRRIWQPILRLLLPPAPAPPAAPPAAPPIAPRLYGQRALPPRAQVEPLRAPVEPLRAPAEPPRAPIEAPHAQVEPLHAQVEPPRAPVEQMVADNVPNLRRERVVAGVGEIVVVRREDDPMAIFRMWIVPNRQVNGHHHARCLECKDAQQQERRRQLQVGEAAVPMSVESFTFARFGEGERWIQTPLNMARHNVGCRDGTYSLTKHIVNSVLADVRTRVADEGANPERAYTNAACTTLYNYAQQWYPDVDVYQLSMAWAPYHVVRRQFYRLAQGNLPTIHPGLEHLHNLPDVYAVTVFGRMAPLGHPDHREPLVRQLLGGTVEQLAMVVCCSPSAAAHLGRCRMISGDGTFKLAPRRPIQWQQVYTIIGRDASGEHVVDLYALMQTRHELDYRLLFNNVRRWIEEEHGGTIGELAHGGMFMADFEPAVSAAMRHEFPELLQKFCTFHFAQMVIRKVQNYGLTRAYRDGDAVVRPVILEVLGFMLCPPDEREALWQVMRNGPDHPNERMRRRLQRLLDYVQRVHMLTAERRSRLDAFTTPAGFDRTNNPSEGNHRGFYASIGVLHPRLEKLLHFVNQRDHTSAIRRLQLPHALPHVPRPRLRRYRLLDDRIAAACARVLADIAIIRTQQQPEEEVHRRLRTHLRHCARLLGGAVHDVLVGDVVENGDVDEEGNAADNGEAGDDGDAAADDGAVDNGEAVDELVVVDALLERMEEMGEEELADDDEDVESVDEGDDDEEGEV
jgi:hypothetical protein